MFDIHAISAHLTAVCDHYERTAPTVRDWADALYVRIGDEADGVRLSEVMTAVGLNDADGWLPPPLAANRVYKLMSRLGQDTTGHAGF